MPLVKGQCIGGIRTLEDLRARCVVDEITGCWHLRTPQGQPLPTERSRHYVWVHGAGVMTFRRAAWLLKYGWLPELPVAIFGWHCLAYDCANPNHMRARTRLAYGRHQQQLGLLKSVETTIRNRANNRKRRKLDDELRRWAIESVQPTREAAYALGVSQALVSRLRVTDGLGNRKAPAVASVFEWRGQLRAAA